MLKKESTLFLKSTLIVFAVIVLLLCIFALPSMWQGSTLEFPYAVYALSLIMIGLYITVIPFFIALWQTWKLLRYIDKDQAFSDLSIKALRTIKHCAIVISVLYMGGVPLLFPIAEMDDAPGLLLFGFAIACAPVVIAVFANVLEKLLMSAIHMKSENDLTV